MTQPVVFISYSHQDEKEKEQLLSHLSVLQRAGLIEVWSEDRIVAGADWKSEMNQAMAQARVVILLISANYLSSDFIVDETVPALLQRREREGLIIFPVIAKPCPWRTVGWLTQMRVRPRGGQPVWREEGRYADDELSSIAEEIAQTLKQGDNRFLFPPVDPPPRPPSPSPSPDLTPKPYPQVPPEPQPVGRSGSRNILAWLLILGGLLALVPFGIMAGINIFQDRTTPTSAGSQIIPTDEPVAGGTFTPTSAPPGNVSEAEARFGEIKFAEGFRGGNLVGVGTQFSEDIREIHAIFDYYDMSPEDTWKRVWYLEDEVVAESSGGWEEAPQGIFDLFLGNNGRPLAPGTWRLELYINDTLVQEGSFTISGGVIE